MIIKYVINANKVVLHTSETVTGIHNEDSLLVITI